MTDFRDLLNISTLLNYCTLTSFIKITSFHKVFPSLYCILSCYHAVLQKKHFSLNFVSWLLYSITHEFFISPALSVFHSSHLNYLCHISYRTFVTTPLEIKRIKFYIIKHKVSPKDLHKETQVNEKPHITFLLVL